ncbi:MAG: hypothetical protein HYV26_23680 [Candidatus Hydrogenedentes bacterium]|nr:hypothetical protein [Candidatus Hydrogenedentota bacterium]MBI3117711.1 hypothetical protein [Candidatus Hydrogenedentota bacterium]
MPEKMLTVHQCSDLLQAEFLKDFLMNNGLHPRLSNDRPGWTGRYATIARGVRIAVPLHESKQAKALIAEAESGKFALSDKELADFAEEQGAAPDTPYVPKACPSCGSPKVVRASSGGVLFVLLNLLFLGIPWLLRSTQWCCADCGYEWTREDIDQQDGA